MELSTSTKNIFEALAQFRAKLLQPKKDASNPQFSSKYVPLESVTHVIDTSAPEFGLAYIQNLRTTNDYTVGVQTMVTHQSGEYIIFDWLDLDARPIIRGGSKGQATSQSQGSAITYGRRYTLAGAFGIASEVDDDGNAASGDKNDNTQPWTPPSNSNNGQTITEPTKSEALMKAKELKKSIAQLRGVTQKQVDEWLFAYLEVKDGGEIKDWNLAVSWLLKAENKAKQQQKEQENNKTDIPWGA